MDAVLYRPVVEACCDDPAEPFESEPALPRPDVSMPWAEGVFSQDALYAQRTLRSSRNGNGRAELTRMQRTLVARSVDFGRRKQRKSSEREEAFKRLSARPAQQARGKGGGKAERLLRRVSSVRRRLYGFEGGVLVEYEWGVETACTRLECTMGAFSEEPAVDARSYVGTIGIFFLLFSSWNSSVSVGVAGTALWTTLGTASSSPRLF